MRRVVVIEDNPDLGTLISRALSLAGNDVYVVPKIEGYLFEPPFWNNWDVAIIDLMLSGSNRNGLYVAEWLMEHCPHVKRIICTALAHVLSQLPERVGYKLEKPFDIDHLVSVVENV